MGSLLQPADLNTSIMRTILLFPSFAVLFFIFSSLTSFSDATIAIAVASGTTTLLSLTAAQVTGLAALKLLGVTAGALLARRGKREEPGNQIDPTSFVALTSSLEPQSCFQLLFCTLASEKVKVDQDVENVYKLVTGTNGKYRQAAKMGKNGKKCSLMYKCSMKISDIIQFYQSY